MKTTIRYKFTGEPGPGVKTLNSLYSYKLVIEVKPLFLLNPLLERSLSKWMFYCQALFWADTVFLAHDFPVSFTRRSVFAYRHGDLVHVDACCV